MIKITLLLSYVEQPLQQLLQSHMNKNLTNDRAIALHKIAKIDITKRPTSYEVDLLTFAFLLHFGSE